MGMYPTMEKADELTAKKKAIWDESADEYETQAERVSKRIYPTMQSPEVQAEAAAMHERVMEKRREDRANGRGDIPSIMYPSMCNVTADEVKAAMKEETKRKEIEDWENAVRIADERQAGQ